MGVVAEVAERRMNSVEPTILSSSRIVIISGPSGTGKTTVVRRLLSAARVPLMKAVTATTRAPRAGEISEVDYHFLTDEAFSERRQQGDFLETAEVFSSGSWYGTPRSEIERIDKAGAWALLEIDVRGALEIKRQFPQAVMIFLRTASLDDYQRRLRGRGTESDEAIARRLARMQEELRLADHYDFQVVNDDVDRAVGEIDEILQRHEGKNDA